MPTYEYTCRACGHTFDVVQPMSDEPLTTCPECGGALRKVFGAPAISFKGSGFYATDHGKRSKQTSERSGDTTAASTETSGDSSDGHSKGEKAGTTDKGGGSGETSGANETAKPAEKTPTGSGAGSGGKASS